jgi:hypothetical protein
VIDEKNCKQCGEMKPLDDFQRRAQSPDGHQPICRACKKVYNRQRWQENKDVLYARQRAWVEANAQKVSDYNREYRRANADRIRAGKLLNAYGIPQGQYEAMLEAQGGACAICGSDTPRSKAANHFHVDHCHGSGRVRGLLCSPCNTGLGKFRDDPVVMLRAVEYLNERP